MRYFPITLEWRLWRFNKIKIGSLDAVGNLPLCIFYGNKTRKKINPCATEHQNVVRVAPYPIESSLFPEHIIIPLITLMIFVVVLYVISRTKRKATQPKDNNHHNTTPESRSYTSAAQPQESTESISETPKQGKPSGDSASGERLTSKNKRGRRPKKSQWAREDVISLVSLIGTMVAAVVIPFTQLSVLDYRVNGPLPTDKENVQKFEIAIHNMGSTTVKNVIVSLDADNTNFLSFTSRPFLANHLTRDEPTYPGQIGKELIEIESLPPTSQTIITATLSQISDEGPEPKLITHVRSDEAVGNHQVPYILTFYAVLSASYAFLALMFVTGIIDPLTKNNTIDYRRIFIIAILILVGIIDVNLLLYLDHIDPDSFLYLIYFYSGVLVIPSAIVILSTIYYLKHRTQDPIVT